MLYPRVLVLTLYSGEAEYGQCCQSVAEQEGVAITHEVISDMPNLEAHLALYERIMEKSSEYDYFVKLDADMVLKHNIILKECIEYISKWEYQIDHALFCVADWYTQNNILGMHIFSPNVDWPAVSDKNKSDHLFVDPDPIIPGYQVVVWEKPAPPAWHAPNPGRDQVIYYGVNRTLKAKMKLNKEKKIGRLSVFQDIKKHYFQSRDVRICLILAISSEIMKYKEDQINLKADKSNKEFQKLYERYNNADENYILKQAKKFWLSKWNFIFIIYIKVKIKLMMLISNLKK